MQQGVMAPFYSFFFGMMIADAGYGLLLLLGTVLALKIFKLREEQRHNEVLLAMASLLYYGD